VLGGVALLDSKKAEALANSLGAQFQLVKTNLNWQLLRWLMRWYMHALTNKLKFTSPLEILPAIKWLKVGKAPGPNRILRHLPKHAITFLIKVFNTVICRQYLPPAWKHVVSILKPGKDPTLPSCYRPISLLDIVGNLFKKILRMYHPDDGVSKHLWNVSKLLPDYTAQHPRI
jgi:hypothetical protein